MLKNHLKIAWRNLKANRMFSVINILGLSLGLAITMVLFLFIRHEQSFDNMYAEKENIYRLLTDQEEDVGRATYATSPPAAAPTAMEEIPEIRYAERMLKNDFGGTASVRANEVNFTEKSFYWVDKQLLDIFKVEFTKGQKETALDRPSTVILSESTAEKYFGADDPVGKSIKVGGTRELEVTGIYKDFPANSTIDCEVMANIGTLDWVVKDSSWYNVSFETYCLMAPNADRTIVEGKLKQLLDKNLEKENQWYSFLLQPLERVHLYSADYSNSYASRIGDISEVRNLSFLALLILLIACINYMNLTTARCQKRSKEVGINKTLGASKSNLVARFYMETGLLTAISMVLGVLLAILAIPLFNRIAGQNLDSGLLLNVEFLIAFFMIWMITTLVSGSYPALYLSGFSPRAVLQTSYRQGKSNGAVRKGLVVLQFAASVVLIVGILVVYQQIQFMQHQKLGFEPENVVAISMTGINGNDAMDALAQQFKGLTGVSSVAAAQGFPGMDASGRALSKNDQSAEELNIETNVTDAGIVEVLNLNLLAGRTLPDVKHEADTIVDVILNKKAVDFLGYSPAEAIGKEVHISVTNRIVGVVDDFNHKSLHVPIGAYAFHNNTGEPKSFLLVRFKGSDIPNLLQNFENTFKEVAPEAAFDYSFLDKNMEKLYEREQRAAHIGVIFCALAIFVACLGLFGLAAFMAEQRKKEISIRKVLGASIFGITQMLSKDFIKLVLVALLIAFPLAFWLMDRWLQDFAYRIQIDWTVFLIAGSAAILIALVTVSFQSVRAALVNPVKSLKAE